MTPREFDTRSFPASEQFEAWRSWYGPVFDSVPRRPVECGFPATHLTWTLDGLVVSRVSAPPVDGRRTKAHIRRNPVDHWVITVYERGVFRIGMDDAWLETAPGVPFVVSLADEIAAERSNDNQRVQLHLARDSFYAIAPLLDAARGMVLSTPLGRLLGEYMLLLERSLPNLAPEATPRLCNAVQAMLEACLAPAADRLAKAGNQINVTMMERVRRAVDRHLRSPSLGPDKLCREAATSRSQLYRLLETEGGVAHYIQRRRLSESFAILCDASNNFPIGKIAEMLCFADASTFSRAFRREFGMNPREVRAASAAGLKQPTRRERTDLEAHSFGDCLRSC